LPTSETWKDKATGERKERTEWHSVVLQSDGLVGVAERFLRKGSKVYIEGQLRTRKWQDASGNDRYTTEVSVGINGNLTMLDWRTRRFGGGGGMGGGGAASARAATTGMTAARRVVLVAAVVPAARAAAVAAAGIQGGGMADDLDDDIPLRAYQNPPLEGEDRLKSPAIP